MGLRERLNENPRLTTGLTIGILGLALLVVVWNLWPSSGGGAALKVQAHYSDDDGQTWFIDDEFKATPFKSSNGRDAVRARVFQCGRRGAHVVGYLEKFDDTAKTTLEQFYSNAKNKGKKAPQWDELVEKNTLVKRPGPGAWAHVVRDAAKAKQIKDFKCQNGQPPTLVQPRVEAEQ